MNEKDIKDLKEILSSIAVDLSSIRESLYCICGLLKKNKEIQEERVKRL